VYAVDKQIQRQDDGGFQLDAEIEERLHNALTELVTVTSRLNPTAQDLTPAN
jgi:hypothetical protein